MEAAESHHTLTSKKKKVSKNTKDNKQRDEKRCMMRFTGFGVAGRALGEISKVRVIEK